MTYIAGLIIVGLFFLVLKYFAQLSKKQEFTIGAIVLVVVLSAIAFNAYSTQQRDSMLGAVLKFKQSKTIECQGIDVNNSNYTLSIGTYTFIGKKNTPNYGQMVSASGCQ